MICASRGSAKGIHESDAQQLDEAWTGCAGVKGGRTVESLKLTLKVTYTRGYPGGEEDR
jgi:hypothetical protein